MRKIITLIIMIMLIGYIRNLDAQQTDKGKYQKFLAEQEERKTAIKQKVPELIEELKTAKKEKKYFIIRDLGFSEDSRAIQPLIEIVENKKEAKQNRRIAIEYLANMKKEKDKIIPALKKAFKDKDTKVLAAHSLCRLGETQDALPFLEQYAKEGNPEVLLYPTAENQDEYFDKERAKQIFVELADEANDNVRARVAVYLLKMGETARAKQTAINVAKNTKTIGPERGRIITYIIHVLVSIGDDESVQVLADIMNTDPSEYSRDNAADALSKLGRKDLVGKYKLKQLGIESK